jgi:predicted lactoylglutathione lyase
MKSNQIWANMAVSDLDRTTRFYTVLGFKSNGASKDLISFFFGENNFIIHFFLKDKLQPALKGNLADLQTGNEIIFTISAGTKAEVDQWAQKVRAAGGTLVSQPEEFGEGYYGFVFSDPDGHKFNIFFM